MKSAVNFVRKRAESTNLIQDHPLRSYKHESITLSHSKRTQTPTGPSGRISSTQRLIFTAARRLNTSSESYTIELGFRKFDARMMLDADNFACEHLRMKHVLPARLSAQLRWILFLELFGIVLMFGLFGKLYFLVDAI